MIYQARIHLEDTTKMPIFYYVSDIHLELDEEMDLEWLKPEERGILLLAGDVGNPFKEHYKRLLDKVSEWYDVVIVVPGNHEYYSKHTYKEVNQQLYDLASNYHNVYVLINDTVMVHGVKIVGTTLWSWIPKDKWPLAIDNMNDYTLSSLTPEVTCNMHRDAVLFLNREIKDTYPVVVVTHHLPTYKMISQKYAHYPLNCCYASHLDNLLKPNVVKWVCGHTHISNDYMQCTCNPLGYKNEVRTFTLRSFAI